MRNLMIATLLAATMATGALAQEQKPQQPLLAEYHFTFTPQQIGVIEAGLNELPMRIAAPMLQVMREQALAQQAKAQETAKGEPAAAAKNKK